MYNTTRSFLKHNNNIIICKSDKANNTVAMNKGDYDERASDIVSDVDTYQTYAEN